MIHPDSYQLFLSKRSNGHGIPDAPKSRRFVNLVVDYIVTYIMLYLLYQLLFYALYNTNVDLAFLFRNEDSAEILQVLMGSLIYFMLSFVIEAATKGRTLGKLVTGTVAIRRDGSPITAKDALIRSIGRLLPFNAFVAIYTAPWHDQLSKTRVVRKVSMQTVVKAYNNETIN